MPGGLSLEHTFGDRNRNFKRGQVTREKQGSGNRKANCSGVSRPLEGEGLHKGGVRGTKQRGERGGKATPAGPIGSSL